MSASVALSQGFEAPGPDSQSAFRAVMMAMAKPGTRHPLDQRLVPPFPLTVEMAILALALADPDAPLFLDQRLAASVEVSAYLRFHTGAPIVADCRDAAFALISDAANLLPLEKYGLGTDEYPDRSTTIILAVDALEEGPALRFAGPGIRETIAFAPRGLPDNFARHWHLNHAKFPCGIDLVLVGPGEVAALPRSARLLEA